MFHASFKRNNFQSLPNQIKFNLYLDWTQNATEKKPHPQYIPKKL